MFQNIEPHKFYNEFKKDKLTDNDYLFIFKEDSLLIQQKENDILFPKLSDVMCAPTQIRENITFLFTIDEINYYYVQNLLIEESGNWKFELLHNIRGAKPEWKVFAAAVGGQLHKWYQDHKYCGRCATKMKPHDTERALQCPSCGNLIYPTLSPSVIVAITNQDKLLLTKYAYGVYRNYALVAGYAEIGEELEETVRREVMEEVGLRVKNITYYKTQPWPFSGALLIGYFAEVDGDDEVTLQESELAEATWFKREDVPKPSNTISLTSEMIELFINGGLKKKVEGE